MPTIIFTTHDGEPYTVDTPAGSTVMAAALSGGVPGIDADCGGGCSCGTCHVIVAADWIERLPPIEPMEEGLLDFVPDRETGSRLSCQITVTGDLEGLRLRVPEHQM